MSRPIRWAAFARACLCTALLLAPAWAGAPLHAQEAQIEATRFTFDREANVYRYEEARLTLGQLSLFASRLELDAATGRMHAEGFVRVQTDTLSGMAESMELDGKTRVGELHGASLREAGSGLYLRAESVTIQPDGGLELRHCTLTACPPGVPGAWSIAASSLSVQPDDLAVAWNPRLSLGPVPVFWLPGMVWPLVPERRSGVLIPEVEQDTSSLDRFDLGWRLRVPLFLNLGYDHDLTITPEWIEKRGSALGLEYNYAFWERQTGRLTLWGAHERGPRDPAQENDILTLVGKTPPDEPLARYRADWVHNQALGDAGRLVLSYRDSSDGQVRREYDRVTEYRPFRTYEGSLAGQSRWADAALTFSQSADYLEESVYARGRDFTDLEQRPQLLPRFSTRLGGRVAEAVPLAAELNLSAARFVAPQWVSGNLLTASPTLSLPVSLGGAFELRPTVTRHFVRYGGLLADDPANPDGPDTPLEDASFSQSEGNVELRTRLARVYEPEDGRYAALKHVFTPRLIFTGVQDVPQPFTGAEDSTDPYSGPDRLLRARIAERLLTLRLDNLLLGRGRESAASDAGEPLPAPIAGRAEPPVQELLRVDLIQRYDYLQRKGAPPRIGPQPDRRFETERGEPLLPLLLQAQLGGPHYGVSALLNYHHQLGRNTQTQLSAEGKLNPRTRVGFGYAFNEFTFVTPDNKLVPGGNSLTFDGVVSWSDALSTGFAGRVNLQDAPPPLDRRIDRGALFVDYHPICYAVRLSYSEAVAATVESGVERFYVDRHVQITFNLGGLVGGPKRAAPASAAAPAAASDLSSTGVAPAPRPLADASSPAICRG